MPFDVRHASLSYQAFIGVPGRTRRRAAYDVFLTEKAKAVGQALRDLSLPERVVVAAIYREDHLITPRGDFVFRAGDHVFLISERADEVSVPKVFSARA